MNEAQELENARMIASLLGLDDESAIEKLDVSIQLIWTQADTAGALLGNFVGQLLERTFRSVNDPTDMLEAADVVLLINGSKSVCRGRTTVYCQLGSRFICGLSEPVERIATDDLPEILCLLSACFAAAQVANYALQLPDGYVSAAGVQIDFSVWPGVENEAWSRETNFEEAQFVGAGAIGNAVIFALQLLPTRIQGGLIDPKTIAAGILNRCLLFEESDIGDKKADVLARNALGSSGKISLRPISRTLSQARELLVRLSYLVVGVDSRLGRRQIQEELPLEVFDASTTGIKEVVFHHNQLFSDGACLACIYKETEGEVEFAQHVADVLNVSAADVRQEFISHAAAANICKKHPDLGVDDLVGKAYTTIFRQRCATGMLTTPEQQQVLAPFAFVSQLAGTVLAIEMFLRKQNVERQWQFNYWRINPWRGISVELQSYRNRNPSCRVCSDSDYKEVASQIWSPMTSSSIS